MKRRVIIADDEAHARTRLRILLEREADIDILAECTNGIEALNSICETQPDIVFLDIKMPELDGFEVLKALKDCRVPVPIFVTAHDQFAIRAFEAHAVDYLLKPFDGARLSAALERARQRLRAVEQNRLPEILEEHLQSPFNPRERLVVKSGGKIYFIKTADVDWISAAQNYVELHVGKTVHLVRGAMASLAKELPEDFLPISRSILVNRTRIKEMRSKSHGDWLIILENGVVLQGSRNYRPSLTKILYGKA